MIGRISIAPLAQAHGVLFVLCRALDRARFRLGARALVLIVSALMAITSLWVVVGAHINPERVGRIFSGVNVFTMVYVAIEPQIATIFKQLRLLKSQAVNHGPATRHTVDGGYGRSQATK